MQLNDCICTLGENIATCLGWETNGIVW